MKKRTIIDIILIFLLLGILIFLGTRDYSKKTENKDSKRFDKDYSMVSSDNVFKYSSDEEVLNLLKKDNAIIFMGFKENKWSNYYASMLNTAAKNTGVDTIYYYDFLADREKKSVNYVKIVNKISDYLKKDDMDNINLVAPSLVVIKDGVIIFYDDETSITNTSITPEKYWTEYNKTNKLQQFESIFKNYLGVEVIGGLDGGEE